MSSQAPLDENDVLMRGAPEHARMILIVTDAWAPQVNGVVRTLEGTVRALQAMGHVVKIISPDAFRTIPLPSYPEIRLALFAKNTIARVIDSFRPDAIHIATEGTLGLAARRVCVRWKIPFSTAFHTRYPDYVHARYRIPRRLTWAWLKWFHKPAASVMVATETLRRELLGHGFGNVRIWSRGADTQLFRPRPGDVVPELASLERPLWLNVGRMAVEKNMEGFLALDLPGTKVVVGEGPQMAMLQAKYPRAVFLGLRHGENLARIFASCDAFVFPSRTDTFGLVLAEALASGLPVAAYPEQAPCDVLGGGLVDVNGMGPAGVLDDDLGRAAQKALTLSREAARAYGLNFSWDACTLQFVENLVMPEVRRRLYRQRLQTA